MSTKSIKLNLLLLFSMFLFLSIPTIVGASPYIVYAPQMSAVENYEIEINNVVETVAPTPTDSGGSRLVYDIGDMAPGEYTIRARVKHKWWPFTPWSVPFTFTIPDVGLPMDGVEITDSP